MTTVEYTTQFAGAITLHVETQAADVQVVADPRVKGTWIELSTADESGLAVTAIRQAEFRDNGANVHLTLNETAGGNQFGGNVQFGNGNTMTIVNGVIYGTGQSFSGGVTVRAITGPDSNVEVKTMSGDVVTKNVPAVRASTMSGDIDAAGVTAASTLTSLSGDITVTGSGAARVKASSMSGDVTGSGVDLTASSMSGQVRQLRPRRTAEF